MNRLEIFQEVYGKDYVFTETELSQLQQVAELIVRECAAVLDKRIAPPNHPMNSLGYELKQHFGVEA